jgi:hypothetical protein
MSKDPAILFYTGDFLSGTAFFNDEQRGQYIRLLCEQHQNGHIPEEHMINICKTYDSPVLKKFVKDSVGLYFNERMEKEVVRRLSYSESRRSNRLNKKEESYDKTYDKTYDVGMSTHMDTGNRTDTDSLLRNRAKEYWEKWKNYKKAEFKFSYKSEVSENAAKKELFNLSDNNLETAIKIIDQSIANGWKGFFKLKNNSNGNSKQTGLTGEQLAGACAKAYITGEHS